MKTQTLIESISPSVANIVCESNQSQTMWLSGTFMQADVKNRNRRVYPVSEMVGAVQKACDVIKENGGIFGELDHPENLTINMDRISHAITELRMSGNNVFGRAKLLRTPMGLIAEELGRSGVRYGISSRGAGQVNESDGTVSGFVFVTADLVATPSAPGAFPKPVYESLQNSKEGNKVLTLAEAMREDEPAQKYFKREVLSFVDNVFNRS
jgi:hypothetical protein